MAYDCDTPKSFNNSTVCIKDLDKPSWFYFTLEPIFTPAPAALLALKVVKCDPKIMISFLLPRLRLNPRYTR